MWQCVVVKPGKAPEVVKRPKKGEPFEGVFRPGVGGYVEVIPWPWQYDRGAGLCVLANESGVFTGLPYNRWGIVGTFFVSLLPNWNTLVGRDVTPSWKTWRTPTAGICPR